MNKRLTGFYFSFFYSCSLMAQAVTVEVVTSDKQPVENAVVYLEPLEQQTITQTNKTIEIGQQGKSFNPYISVMQQGSKVKFTNKDDITHHIYSPLGENKFSFKIKAGQSHEQSELLHTGIVTMGCNIHDWMSGHLLILDTPYFDKTDKNGNVEIALEQSGYYQLTVWHPQFNEPDNKLSLKINTNEQQQIRLSLTKAMAQIPKQSNEDDFDFLSDY